MKLVVQRVSKATVTIKETNRVSGEINDGLFVLLGVKQGDSKDDAKLLADKLTKLRIMSDENGRMNLNVLDAKGKILVVSQFTLHANTKDGNRPSFIDAARPEEAKEIYHYFIDCLISNGVEVQTGEFGAYMEIKASLDGPVTIILES